MKMTNWYGGENMAFRKKRGSDTWHFCKNCTLWPTVDYDEQSSKPTTGELCNQCKAKQKESNCK